MSNVRQKKTKLSPEARIASLCVVVEQLVAIVDCCLLEGLPEGPRAELLYSLSRIRDGRVPGLDPKGNEL